MFSTQHSFGLWLRLRIQSDYYFLILNVRILLILKLFCLWCSLVIFMKPRRSLKEDSYYYQKMSSCLSCSHPESLFVERKLDWMNKGRLSCFSFQILPRSDWLLSQPLLPPYFPYTLCPRNNSLLHLPWVLLKLHVVSLDTLLSVLPSSQILICQEPAG